jgi:L-ascorbate metabolism protein UlaG (beta-lactamase superfamily)
MPLPVSDAVLPKGLEITWLGHSAFRIRTPAGKRILIDPWVQNNPACPPERKDVGPIDLMLVTHGHFDHIADAVPIAKSTGCRVVGIFELTAYLTGKGGVAADQVQPMNKGGTLRFDDLLLSVTMVHADHSCGIQDGDQILYGGEAVGFVVTLDDGFAFYHAGDTAVFSDMALIAELYRPQIAFLPVGDRFVMSPREAAKAVSLLSGVRAVVPMHFGTFPLLTGTPEAFRAALVERGVAEGVEVISMAPGETRVG